MRLSKTYRSLYVAGLALAFAGALLTVGALNDRAAATHQPADKMFAAGSALEIMTAPLTEGSASETHTLFTGNLRTSSPTDLVFRVTAECALWTDVTTVGNDESEAVAAVKVWIEVDGEPVPVASDDDGEDAGQVVFCNRAYKRTTLQFDDEDATIETYLNTRAANAFDWITLNVGSGVHEVSVKAQLEAQVTGMGMAKAAIGKRTLTVEPVKLANDASI